MGMGIEIVSNPHGSPTFSTNTGMADGLPAGKPPQYFTSHQAKSASLQRDWKWVPEVRWLSTAGE